jgi:FlgD Ig-like domain
MNVRVLFASCLFFSFLIPVTTRAQWTPNGVPLCTATGAQTFPSIAQNGGAIVAWEDRRSGTHADIYAGKVDPSGAVLWTVNGVAVSTAAGNKYGPKVIADGTGGAIVTWNDARSGSESDIYAQRITASGAIAWAVDGVPVCTAPGDQYDQAIIPDRIGGAIIAWSDSRDGDINADIYAQRINASGVTQWTPDGIPVCTALYYQAGVAMAPDGHSGAIMAWYDGRNNIDDNIYAQRISASGAPLWTADGVALCTAPDEQYSVAMVPDGAGGACVAWQDFRSGTDFDIYACKVDASGVPQWTADGVALSTAANDQVFSIFPKIGTDGAGGAIVAWQDYRSDEDGDVYAQRIDASGAVQWTADGLALCTASGSQYLPTIAADGGGAAIVAWGDGRGTGPDTYNIYAQRVAGPGVTQWTPDGIPLETAAGQQDTPAMVPDGSGGAYATWVDFHSTSGDIYVGRIGPAGMVPTGIHDTPSVPAATLSANSPNPFATETEMTLDLPSEVAVKVDVFDAAGRRVRHLDLGRARAGSNRLAFDGRDDHARALPSGVYFFRVLAGGETVTRKMVIAR